MKVAADRLNDVEMGIPVRAQGVDGKWGSHDVAHLDRPSLIQWLRSRDRDWAIDVVLLLLEHQQLQDGEFEEEKK